MMQENAAEVHLVMNTNNQDQGVVNARLLGDMLGEGLKNPSSQDRSQGRLIC